MENRELEQRIRERAYEIWEYRMENDMLYTLDRLGNTREITAQDDWLEAEEEVRHAKELPERVWGKEADTNKSA